ncbi:hypothetical protein HMPREF1221_01639 [Treponema socranskii subsp. paredis ATCC 35535]|nr:hypothetical protein HMPREF1221_01639 [Treponema socranskii subsp. paredis ATCC 35535]
MKNPKTKHLSKIIKISAAALLLATVSVSCGNMAEDPNAAYFAKLENDVLEEINFARTQPAQYAKTRLEPYAVKNPTTAITECINEMKAMQPLPPLKFGKGLALAAKEWVNVQGPGGGVGHDMHTDPRIRKHWACSTWGENISYGYDDARMIVIRLLEDDSDPGRRHRKKILSRAYTHVGIGCGLHKIYRFMCVQDFAG